MTLTRAFESDIIYEEFAVFVRDFKPIMIFHSTFWKQLLVN